MKIDLNFFRQKARPIRAAIDDPIKNAIRLFSNGNKVGITYWDVVNAERAMQHPVARRCIHKIGLACQDVKWYAEQDPNSSEKVSKADLKKLNNVLENPNDNMDAAQLRYWLGLNKAVYGRFAIKIGALTTGGPNAIYPLAQRSFKTVFANNGAISEYRYGDDQRYESLPTRGAVDPGYKGTFTKAFGYEYVVPDLEGVYAGATTLGGGKKRNNSPLNAIALPMQIIDHLLKRAVDTASGHPNSKYIISGEKTMTSDQQDEVEDMIEERKTDAEESGSILFLANTSIKVDTLDNGLSDIHSKIPSDDMARIIYANYGIPVALAGIGSSDAAKFAGNYEASRRSFYEDTIIPDYLGPISSGLTFVMCPPGARIMFDYDSISGLGDARVNKAKGLQGVPFLTDQEKRVMSGFPPAAEKYNDGSSSSTSDQTTTPPSGQNAPAASSASD
jgi:hypothetical protein